MSETSLLRRIMLRWSRDGVRLFRNNIGVAVYPDGSKVRYGLFPGSADLIGLKSMTITPEMVGQRIAVFVSIECKTPRTKPTLRQRHWAQMVKMLGGFAGTARSVEDARKILEGEDIC